MLNSHQLSQLDAVFMGITQYVPVICPAHHVFREGISHQTHNFRVFDEISGNNPPFFQKTFDYFVEIT